MTGPPGTSPAPARLWRALTYPLRLGDADEDWPSTRFGRLSLVNLMSSAGDALVAVALAGSVFVSVPLHAARGRTALGLLLTMLPFAVVAPLTGPAADRLRRGKKRVLVLAALARMVAALMMAAWIHSLALFPAAFLSLVASRTHGVARSALIPSATDNDADLVKANSRLAVGSGAASVLAAPVGAGIYALFGSEILLQIDAFVFALGASLTVILVRYPTGEADGAEHATARRSPIPAALLRAGLVVASSRAVTGFLTALVAFGFRSQGAPAIWYGLAAAAGVAGSMGGALLAPAVGRAAPSEWWPLYGSAVLIAVAAGSATTIGWQHGRLAVTVVAGACGLAGAVAKTTFDSMVQVMVGERSRTRAFGRFEASFQAAWVLLALVPTLLVVTLTAGLITVAAVMLAAVIASTTRREAWPGRAQAR